MLELFVLVFGAALAGVLLFTMRSRMEKAVLARAQNILADDSPEAQSALLMDEEHAATRRRAHWRTRLFQHVRDLLEQAALKLSLTGFFGICLASGVAGLLGAMIFFPIAVVELVSFVGCSLIPYFWVKSASSRRLDIFNKELPGAIDMMLRALRSGYSISMAIDMVAKQCAAPLGTEFRILSGQIRMGLSQSEALVQLCERIPSPDLHFIVTAILLQRETGGNLPEIFEQVLQTIRERIRILGELRVKTTQGRVTGIVLSIAPVGLALLMKISAPEMFNTLMYDPVGRKMIYYSIASIIVGTFAIKAVIKIEV